MNKRCSSCGENKPVVAFSRNRSEPDGLQGHCRQCQSERYQRNRDKRLAQVKTYAATHKVEKMDYDLKRRAEIGDSLRAYDRVRDRQPHRIARALQWQKENPEKRRAINSRSQKKNWNQIYARLKASFLRQASIRRARILNAFDGDELSVLCIEEACRLSAARASITGGEWHIDHVVPLARGGRHAWHNLQVVPATWNMAKGARNADWFFPHFQRTV